MPFKTKDWLNNYLKTRLGYPLLNALPKEVNAMQSSIDNALIQYWSSFPYQYMMHRDLYGRTDSEFEITEDEILDEAFKDDSGNSVQTIEYPAVGSISTTYGSMDESNASAIKIPSESSLYLPMRPKTVKVEVRRGTSVILTLTDNGSGFLLSSNVDNLWTTGTSIATIDYNTGNLHLSLQGSLEVGDTVRVTFTEKNDRKRKATVMGILRMDETVTRPHFPGIYFPNLGWNRRNIYTNWWHGRGVNIELDLLEATEEDYVHGEVEYRYDVTNRAYKFIGPIDYYQFTIVWGLAFLNDSDLEFIRPQYINIFSKLVLAEFLDIIIKSRSLVEISSDVTLNISSLETQLSDLKTELQEELQKYVLIPAAYS